MDKKIINRLHRISGQVRGIEKMIDTGAEMEKIIIQVQAIQSAMLSVKKMLVEKKLENTDQAEELKEIVQKYLQ